MYDGMAGSGMLGALNSVGMSGGSGAGLAPDDIKDPYMQLTPNATSSDAAGAQKAGNNIFDPFGTLVSDNEVIEEVEEVLPTIDDYELNANSDIQDRPQTSIFDIISVRYLKSGYPVLLKQRAPASKKEEVLNQK
jgi:hypothetical protein